MTPADLLRAFQWVTIIAILGSALFLGIEFVIYSDSSERRYK